MTGHDALAVSYTEGVCRANRCDVSVLIWFESGFVKAESQHLQMRHIVACDRWLSKRALGPAAGSVFRSVFPGPDDFCEFAKLRDIHRFSTLAGVNAGIGNIGLGNNMP